MWPDRRDHHSRIIMLIRIIIITRLKLASIFRELFDFKAYKLNKVTLEDGVVVISIKRTRKTSDCPECNKRSSNVEEEYVRRIRDLNLGEKKCYIVFIEHKINCNCGYRGVEKLPKFPPL